MTLDLCVFNVGDRNESVCEMYSEQNPERERMICHTITQLGHFLLLVTEDPLLKTCRIQRYYSRVW